MSMPANISSSSWVPSSCLMSPPRPRSTPTPTTTTTASTVQSTPAKHPLSFMLSSAFLNEERQTNEILFGSSLGAPTNGVSFIKNRSLSEATASSITSGNEGVDARSDKTSNQRTPCDRSGTTSSSYLKSVDYTSPTATVQLGPSTEMHQVNNGTGGSGTAQQSTKTVSFSEPISEGPKANKQTHQPSQVGEPSIHRLRLQQEPTSLQRTLREADERLKRTSLAPKGKDLLYQGLPYTWREVVPFDCPITHPEIMSYDPNNYHSVVAKQTRDIGMRVIDLSLLRRGHRSLESIDLNVERGVKGMSLRKHSTQFRMEQLATYPGIGAILH